MYCNCDDVRIDWRGSQCGNIIAVLMMLERTLIRWNCRNVGDSGACGNWESRCDEVKYLLFLEKRRIY